MNHLEQSFPPKFKNAKRGQVWIADLNHDFGSEQRGIRQCLVLNTPQKKEQTVLIVPASNTIRAQSVQIKNYRFLCHQVRVLDQKKLIRKLERISKEETDIIALKISYFMQVKPPVQDGGRSAFVSKKTNQ